MIVHFPTCLELIRGFQNSLVYYLENGFIVIDVLDHVAGACGYGEYGRTVYDGQVAAVARLYRNGTGCGGCYQVQYLNLVNHSSSPRYVTTRSFNIQSS